MRLLRGWRNRPAGDVAALVSLIVRVGEFAEMEANTLVELDINPVIVRPKGAFVADALIIQICRT